MGVRWITWPVGRFLCMVRVTWRCLGQVLRIKGSLLSCCQRATCGAWHAWRGRYGEPAPEAKAIFRDTSDSRSPLGWLLRFSLYPSHQSSSETKSGQLFTLLGDFFMVIRLNCILNHWMNCRHASWQWAVLSDIKAVKIKNQSLAGCFRC